MFNKIISTTFILLLYGIITAQQYDLRFSKLFTAPSGSVDMQIEIKESSGTGFMLSDSDFRFTYNSNLSAPVLQGNTTTDIGAANYTVTGTDFSNNSLFSVNLVLTSADPLIIDPNGTSNTTGTNWFAVAVVRFAVSNNNNPVDLFWQDVNSSPQTIVFEYIRSVNNVSYAQVTEGTLIDNQEITVAADLIVLLEGPYIGNGMMHDKLATAWLNWNPSSQLIPSAQPYNTVPYNYNGTEQFTTLPTNTVDWVLVSLRTDLNNPATTVAMMAALLRTDGQITDVNGNPSISFKTCGSITGYMVVEHRNHLAAVTLNPISTINGVYEYDYTTTSDNFIQKVINGIFVMSGGNSNVTDNIQRRDINAVDISLTFDAVGSVNPPFPVYHQADSNLDGELNSADKFGLVLINHGRYSPVIW